jgi:hypothetical protein
MHIQNFSVASLFSEMQSLFATATGSTFSVGAGYGQNMPTSSAGNSPSSSLAPTPLSATPASQFSSDVLSFILSQQSQQASQSQTLAGDIISQINPGGSTLDLSQVEQALTGSTATTSPQQMGIANAFSQLTGGTDVLTQSMLAQSLDSLSSVSNAFGMFPHHHHHHDWQSDASSAASGTSGTSGTSGSSGSSDTSGGSTSSDSSGSSSANA